MKDNTFVPKSTVSILIVICGATATGKSGLAMSLAQRLSGVILSADSRQVYREFNIGTAKPSLLEQQQIPHYLIDICDPIKPLTLADYQQQAQELIGALHGGMRRWGDGEGEGDGKGREDEETRRRGDTGRSTNRFRIPDSGFAALESKTQNPKSKISAIPLLVGGTGLYIRSIVRGLKIPRVAPQANLRLQLQSLGQPQCYQFLRQVDPVSVQKIHPNDQVRTLRALEVFYVTGQPISQQQGEDPPDYPILQIGLDCFNSQKLGDRIAKRTAQMLTDGFVEEVKMLCEKYGADLPLLNTLGYREMKQYLVGEISLAEAEALIVLHTRQFAKQQRTWFRADPQIEWFDADAPDLTEQVWTRILKFLASSSLHDSAS